MRIRRGICHFKWQVTLLGKISTSEKIIIDQEKIHWQFFVLMQLPTNRKREAFPLLLVFRFRLSPNWQVDVFFVFIAPSLSSQRASSLFYLFRVLICLFSFPIPFESLSSKRVRFSFSKKDLILIVEFEFVFSADEDQWLEWTCVCRRIDRNEWQHRWFLSKNCLFSPSVRWRNLTNICLWKSNFHLIELSFHLLQMTDDGQNKRLVLFYDECRRENDAMGQERCRRFFIMTKSKSPSVDSDWE